MKKLTFTVAELSSALTNEGIDFPKYTTQLMNLANQNSQGTRPKNVGQLSDLIQECPHKSYGEWVDWYLEKYPEGVYIATNKIEGMIENLKEAILKIDRELIAAWVLDLVLTKTFVGLKTQEAILVKLALMNDVRYRLATPEEESKGIDGYLGDKPVQIKAGTYQTKNMLHDNIDVEIIYYEKKGNRVTIFYE